ncbi:hypothetical protein B7463_g7717, partial [Scytalidium lignicola]
MRPINKRGRKSRSTPEQTPTDEVTLSWRARQQRFGGQELLTSLFNVYLNNVHPNYPILPGDISDNDWQRWIGLSDQASYVLLMAMCALGARHIETGAIFTTVSFDVGTILHSDTYLLEAIHAIPFRLSHCKGLDYIRAFGLLALCAIQRSDYSSLHRYLGLYHGLVAQDGFHDESRWPKHLTVLEIELRRRVYWCMYRLEVHSACVLGHMIRVSELQSSVLYPSPTMDAQCNCGVSQSCDKHDRWLIGWNLNTDLYRILEHTLLKFRTKKSLLLPIIRPQASPSLADVLEAIANLQRQLPVEAVKTRRLSITNDVRLGFQGANMFCKSQLTKMLAFITADTSLNERCQVINELIEGLVAIPLAYLKAFGSPMVHELSGVGHLLGLTVSENTSIEICQEVMRLILCLSELFDGMAGSIKSAAEAGRRLRDLSTKLENKIQSQRYQDKARAIDQLHITGYDQSQTQGTRFGGDILSASFQQTPISDVGSFNDGNFADYF